MKKILERGDILKYLRKTMRIMRLSLFLIMISTAMAFSATSYSQNTKLTLDLNNATVKEVIKAIEDQSEFLFFYQEKHVDLNRQVTLHATEQDVETILNQLFAETNNIYVINDRQIVIGVAPRRELEKQILRLKGDIKTVIEQPQQKEITGKVTDTDGLPLPGVSIIVKGTTIGTVTNNDGEFSLNIPLNAETLQFSFVGMWTQEVVVGTQTSINVTMEEETIGIEEVVAIGYGTVRKCDLTGSVSNVQGELISDRQTPQLSHALQGALPGVMVTRNGNRPGSDASIRIRGITTIGDSDPLIIIDGRTGSLNDINPQDIKNISVLKDAASASIYGSRAAAGVILIETERAVSGQSSFEYDVQYGFDTPTRLPEYVGAVESMKLYNEAR
ncbi:MAG: TonB-dependent receptor plug domain-containing protein, partial [Bacteroidales bacterium]|nr:TonB-dependent receptor plug domain-containing protein [Bacteroidales bacterium]